MYERHRLAQYFCRSYQLMSFFGLMHMMWIYRLVITSEKNHKILSNEKDSGIFVLNMLKKMCSGHIRKLILIKLVDIHTAVYRINANVK